VQVETAHNLDLCPHCNLPFEIGAVELSLVSGNTLLFVCPGCGLTRAESLTEARRKLRARIDELSRLLVELKSKTLKRGRL
jgi:predicted DNA-binding helix-hairpin-helix protein